MIVCMSRRIAVNLYQIILEKRPDWKQKVKVVLTSNNQDDESWHNLMQAITRVNRVYKDKEAGLIVDYIGMAAELKSALSQYTKRDQDKIPDLGQALCIVLEKLEIMRDMFYGFDYSDFFGQSDFERLAVIGNGVDFALGMER